MTLPQSQRMGREGFPLPLQNEDALRCLSAIKQNVDNGNAGCGLLETYLCLFHSGELIRVVINFLFFFQRCTRTFIVVVGIGGMTVIGGGDRAMKKMEELTNCLERTVQLLVWILCNIAY